MARKSNKPNINLTVGSRFFVVEGGSFLNKSIKFYNAEVVEELKTVVKIQLQLEGSDFIFERTMKKQNFEIVRKGSTWGEGEYLVYENKEQYLAEIKEKENLNNRKQKLRETFEELLNKGSLDDLEKALDSLK